MSRIAPTPQPPSYAVIAPTELAAEIDIAAYAEMVAKLFANVSEQPVPRTVCHSLRRRQTGDAFQCTGR
jgi:hypothetical protein